MNLPRETPPYFERLVQMLAGDDAHAVAAFGRHVHWGYWSDPPQAELTGKAYGRAAEAMCLKVLECADLHDGLNVLDVGCGYGGTIACLNECYEQMHLFGANIDEQQLQRATNQVQPRAGNRVEFFVADAADLPLADTTVDRVLAVESIFHFDRLRFFAEVGRVLSVGGALTISDFVPDSRAVPYIQAAQLGSSEAVRSAYGSIDISWSIDRYQCVAKEHGLTLSEVRDVTLQTMPTYHFLRSRVNEWTRPTEAEQFLEATRLLEEASRRKFIAYQIVRFEKRA